MDIEQEFEEIYEGWVESTAAYAKSLEKIANDKALKMLSKSERENLKKIAALLDKEKKEDWPDGHEPQGIDDQYVEEMEEGEEVDLNEKWEVGVVYHQDFGGGEISYFRADSVQKNKRWKVV